MAYHNPDITAQYHPLYPKQSGFFSLPIFFCIFHLRKSDMITLVRITRPSTNKLIKSVFFENEEIGNRLKKPYIYT